MEALILRVHSRSHDVPNATDLGKITAEDLGRLTGDEKDAAILRLSATVRSMEEHRGLRIDREQFAAWEARLEQRRSCNGRCKNDECEQDGSDTATNEEQRAEIKRLKRALALLKEQTSSGTFEFNTPADVVRSRRQGIGETSGEAHGSEQVGQPLGTK